MKSIKYLILVVLIGLTVNTQGDIILPKTIQTSHIITNVKDFPDVTFFAVFNNSTNIFTGRTSYSEKIVEDVTIGMNGWLVNCSAEIYAVKNEYLTGKKNEDIDWHDKSNVMKSNIVIPAEMENIPQSKLRDVKLIENKYTIAGFNDSLLVLYKSEEIYKFKEKLHKADSIKWDEFVEGDAVLSKTFN